MQAQVYKAKSVQSSAPVHPPIGRIPDGARPWLEAGAFLLLAWGLSRGLGWQLPGLDVLAIAVAVVAARFGYFVGALTGVAAGLLGLVALGRSPEAFLLAFSDRSHLLAAFALFLLGALVGLVGDMPWSRTARAEHELERVKENFAQLDTRYRVLLEAKEAVDRRIVGQVKTIASLYEAACELETLVPRQIPAALLRLLTRFLEVASAAVYLEDEGEIRLVGAIGDARGRAERLAAGGPLAQVVAQVEPLVAADEHERERVGALLAAPLTYPDGRGRGVIAVEHLPFRQLTPATTQLLSLLADWASRALANSEAFARAQELQADHPVTGVRRSAYLLDRLANEWAAARRYKLPLSALLVRLPALAEASEAEWEVAAAELAAELKSRVRNIDVVGHYRTRDTFMMLLPVTPVDGARVLAGRIAEAVPAARVEVGSNQEGASDVEAMLQELQAAVFTEEARHAR